MLEKLFSDPYHKKSKLSISLDRNVLNSLFLLYAKLEATEI